MRKIYPAVVLIVFMAGFAGMGESGTLSETSSFRCGNDLVSVGDSAAEVKMKCGEPSFVRQTGAKGRSRTVQKRTAKKSATQDADQESRKKKKTVKKAEYEETYREVWSYNLGPTDFIYNLHFEGGVLKRIEIGGRGK